MLDKNIIKNFGLPNNLKDLNLEFCFDDSLADDFVGCGCHCDTYSTKFFIYNFLKEQSVFTMDFYITESSLIPLSKVKISGRRIHLQHIATNSSFRKQGIASFYITKLVNYCSINDIHFITLDVCPDFNDRTNALDTFELTKFYYSFSTDKVKIQVI